MKRVVLGFLIGAAVVIVPIALYLRSCARIIESGAGY